MSCRHGSDGVHCRGIVCDVQSQFQQKETGGVGGCHAADVVCGSDQGACRHGFAMPCNVGVLPHQGGEAVAFDMDSCRDGNPFPCYPGSVVLGGGDAGRRKIHCACDGRKFRPVYRYDVL